MKLLITGAAGFLGGEVVRLALERGHAVRAMVQSATGAESLGLARDRVFPIDLGSDTDLAPAVEGIEGVIHCAAITSARAPDEDLSRRVNIEGTRRLLTAANAAGVRRWVQISSMSAHPNSTSVYGRTKLGADEAIRASTPPPRWTILQPSLIYGPGRKGLVAKTLSLMQRLPVIPIVGSGREPIRPVYVTDVADAALHCLADEVVIGKTYMLGGADEVTLKEFMRRLVRGSGLRRPTLPIPLWICLILAKLGALAVKSPPLTTDNVLGVREARRVDIGAAQRDWGFHPIGLDEGLRRTLESGIDR